MAIIKLRRDARTVRQNVEERIERPREVGMLSRVYYMRLESLSANYDC